MVFKHELSHLNMPFILCTLSIYIDYLFDAVILLAFNDNTCLRLSNEKCTCHLSSLEQANNLREVQAMKRLSPHANIIQLHELIL